MNYVKESITKRERESEIKKKREIDRRKYKIQIIIKRRKGK